MSGVMFFTGYMYSQLYVVHIPKYVNLICGNSLKTGAMATDNTKQYEINAIIDNDQYVSIV